MIGLDVFMLRASRLDINERMLSFRQTEMMPPVMPAAMPVAAALRPVAGRRRPVPVRQRLVLLVALVAAMLLVPLVQGVGASAEETASSPDLAVRQLNALAVERTLDLVLPR